MANVSSFVFRSAFSDNYFRNRAVSERKNLILLVRKSALIDIVFKEKNDTTRRLTLASIQHGIHFIPPPSDIKTFLNDSVDSSSDHGR